MKQNKLISTLTGLGLSDKEAAIYCAALSLGATTIAKIADSAAVKRTSAYSVVESLKNRGLMNIEMAGWKKLYRVSPPERLEQIVESRHDELRGMLPAFSAITSLGAGESMIKYYQGLQSVKNVYEGLIQDVRPQEEYCIISDCKKWYELDEKYFEDFSRRRAKLPINIRLLLIDNEWGRGWKRRECELKFKVKFLAPKTELSTNLVFIPKRVIIHQLNHPVFAIAIENDNIIKMFSEMFGMLWGTASEC